MYQFVTVNYFDNTRLSLPTNNDVYIDMLENEIERNQEPYLISLLGEKMAQDFIYGIREVSSSHFTADGNWLNLLFGKKNNSNQSYYNSWYGFSNHLVISDIGSTRMVSPYANYIYYKLLDDRNTFTTSVGEVVANSENAKFASQYEKMRKAWNDMCDLHLRMHNFIMDNITDYPDYIGLTYSPIDIPNNVAISDNQNLFKKINLLSI